MINEENLNKIYEGILKEQALTTKELNGYGFNSKDLADLIENGILKRLKRGYYTLQSNHFGVFLQLFLGCIQNRNYEKAFGYFDHIYNMNNQYYNADCNYYLYLLSMITELPENYKQYVKSLKSWNIRVDSKDTRYKDVFTHNKIRIDSLKQKFLLALKQLNDLIKKSDSLSVEVSIIKTLLNQAVERQNRTKNHIMKLINRKQYKELIEYLETLQEQHKLSLAVEFTLILAKDLMEVIGTGIIPKKQVFSTDSLFEAITGKNYELALSFTSQYTKKENIDVNDNVIHILLTEIQNIITEKKNTAPVIKEKEEEPKQGMQPKTTINASSCSHSFADIIGYLMKNDLDNSFKSLRIYLESIEKKQYEFLIIDLIKISLIERDIAFTKPMIALTYITRENFEFNISEYIQNFYEALAQNEFDKARIYLDIISKVNNLGQACILTEGLEKVLHNTEEILKQQRNKESLDKVEQSNVENNSNSIDSHFVEKTLPTECEVISRQPSSEEISVPKKDPSIYISKMSQPENKDYDDQEFIKQKLETAYKKGMILLNPMDSERVERILDRVKTISDIEAFCIGSDNLKQIVLRFKTDKKNYVDLRGLSKKGNEAYQKGDYDTCIKVYRQLLEFREAKSFVYAKLGLAYMKKLDKKMAIDYLTVATELSKKENGIFDFTELIANLKGLISEEDQKPRFKMAMSDFENDINKYYGIEQVKQIAELVSSGITIDNACLNAGLDDEKKSIVLLIFAREYYSQGNYTIGDQYLKKVETAKNKSKVVKSLLEEVKRNKKFYKNRVSEEQKRLNLISKAKNNT